MSSSVSRRRARDGAGEASKDGSRNSSGGKATVAGNAPRSNRTGPTSDNDDDHNDTARPRRHVHRAKQMAHSNEVSDAMTTTSLVIAASSVVLLALLIRSSLVNLVFVVASAALMLLNPWVRVFLDLKPVHSDKQEEHKYALFDPARIVRQMTVGGNEDLTFELTHGAASHDTQPSSIASRSLDQSGAYAALRRMPASLRKPISDLEELIVRDCVCTWYDFHSFGEPTFPNEARFSIDYGIGSVYDAMENVKRADITAELSLAAVSVLLVTLRHRRLYRGSAPIFVNDQQRIQTLREALDRVLARHLKRDDVGCNLLRTLLREIFSKQIWNAVCGVGEPDFINQQIVEWHERSTAAASATANGDKVRTESSQRHPYGYATRNGTKAAAAIPHQQPPPNLPARTSPQPPLASSTPERRSSPVKASGRTPQQHLPHMHGADSMEASTLPQQQQPTYSPVKAASSMNTPTPKRPTPLSMAPAANEPRTTQPKAMTMPSPLPQMSSHASSSPPIPKSSRSNSSSASKPVNPFVSGPTSANGVDIDSARRSPVSPTKPSQQPQPTTATGTHVSMGPPQVPARKAEQRTYHDQGQSGSSFDANRIERPVGVRRVPPPTDDSEDAMGAWDDIMPMNIPPTLHAGMHLPDPLRQSMNDAETTAVDPSQQGGYQINDVQRDAERSPATSTDAGSRMAGDKNGSEPHVRSPSRSGALSPSTKAMHSGSTLAASEQNSVPSRPPSRAPSAASGGIPPAPDMAEVLSDRPTSAVFVGLRDAFESFLERGGAANRSLFFSPPSSATVAPREGEALMKLHLGISAISRLVSFNDNVEGRTDESAAAGRSDEEELYRQDAANIVQRGLESLTEADDDGVAGRGLREALWLALQRFQSPEDDGRIPDIVAPVEQALWNRLQGLYEHFWRETCTRPSGGRPPLSSAPSGSSTPARESFSPEPPMSAGSWKRTSREVRPSMDLKRTPSNTAVSTTSQPAGEWQYEPRRKQATTASPARKLAQLQAEKESSTATAPTPHANEEARVSPSLQQSSPERLKSTQKIENVGPVPTLPPRPVPSPQSIPPQQHGPSFEVTVTDVSANAERPHAQVDARTYEVMIAVEGLVSETGGFVLVRHWKDFQQLHEGLSRNVSLPRLALPFPDVKGKSSVALTQEVQEFLRLLLSSPIHMTSEAVQYFVDKGRAGEESSDRMGVLLDSLQLGKGFSNLANGVVNTLQKGTRAAVTRATSFPAPVTLGSGNGVNDRNANLVDVAPVSGEQNPFFSRQKTGVKREDALDAEALHLSDEPTSMAAEQDSERTILDPHALAHLPIGMRKTQHVGNEWTTESGLGISSDIDDRRRPVPPPQAAPLDADVFAAYDGTDRKAGRQTTAGVAPPGTFTSPRNAPAPLPTRGGGSFGDNEKAQLKAAAAESEISQNDLDNLLSCIFAIADEAFHLSGGWTFRRGMLRVFEQIVRTQYWSSILGVFNDLAHSLNHDQLGSWCTEIKTKFWPDEPSSASASAAATEKAPHSAAGAPSSADAFGDAVVEAALEASQDQRPPEQPFARAPPAADVKRTLAQRLATHQRAQAILLSHVPASSAIFMGPGGRQSCERALICIHEEICSPSTSMDLVLTVVLKLCDIIAR